MAKELLVYSDIFDFTAELFITKVEEAKGEEITTRLYTRGGDPLAAWGMIAKLLEHEETINIKVDGKADSAGAYFLLFFDNVQSLDTSEFLLHRAHFEFNPNPSEASQARLDRLNKKLRLQMEARLNIPKFEKLAGVSLNEFFTGDKVIDVTFDAKKAKSIGLIKKITNLAPEQLQALGQSIAAHNKNEPKANEPEPKKPNRKMTIEELKADHPELYSAIFAKGVEEGTKTGKVTGVANEKDRIGAWMKFVDVDPKAVAEGIESGENLSQTATADFGRKALSKEQLSKIESKNADETETEEGSEVTTAIEAYSKAIEKGDKEAIVKAKADLASATAKEESPKASSTNDFEKKLDEAQGITASSKE